METQKLPFEITPEIKRYLEDILYLNDEWSADAEHAFYLIKEEIKGEQSTPRRWGNNKRFWDYLEKQKVVLAYHNLQVDKIKKVVGETPRLNVVATARTHEEHEDGKSPIERFFTRPDHWQEDLEKVSMCATEHHEGGNIVKPYLALRVFKIGFIRELLHKITAKKKEEAARIESNTKTDHQDSKVRFDSLTGVIRYGDEMVKFHRGERSNKPRLALFRELWEFKKHIKNGKITAKGESLPPETFAVRLNMISSAGDFQRNKQAQERLFSLIKGINRELRNKGMPMEIERNNGIQLVITEK